MKDLINVANIRTVDFIQGKKIVNARFIVKSRAGFMTVVDARDFEIEGYNKHPERLISGYNKGALQSVQVQLEGSDYFFTVFARQGKKINMIDEHILREVTVGTINSMFFNTELYNYQQYKAVNSATWASMAYVMNEPKFETLRVA
mgnify:CR=1 FL=1|jgi:hypothetical protein